jgi:hypothetical protein
MWLVHVRSEWDGKKWTTEHIPDQYFGNITYST